MLQNKEKIFMKRKRIIFKSYLKQSLLLMILKLTKTIVSLKPVMVTKRLKLVSYVSEKEQKCQNCQQTL